MRERDAEIERLNGDLKRLAELHNEALEALVPLDRIAVAAKNLIAQKGRHNTELAYRRLAEVVMPANAALTRGGTE